jgi:hypothetical protein
MWVGPASQELERCLGHVRSQGRHPVRAQDLQQGVKALHAGRAPMHQPRSELHGPLEWITGPVGGLWVEAIWVQQRQASQQLGVQPVGLGVLGVVGGQVRRLLGGHQDHRRAAPSQPGGQRHPGVAGWFHHHQHLGGVAGQSGPERFEFLSTRTELVTRPHDHAGLVRTSRPMRSPACDIDPQTNLHLLLLPVVGPGRRRSRRREGSTRHSLSEITSSRSRRWCHQVPNRPCLRAGVGPVRHHGQRARSRPQPLQSLSQQ